jgi:hypothetical protein
MSVVDGIKGHTIDTGFFICQDEELNTTENLKYRKLLSQRRLDAVAADVLLLQNGT